MSSLQETNGHQFLKERGVKIWGFIDKLSTKNYRPQSGACITFAICLYKLFDGKSFVSCWIPQGTGAPGTLHTTCKINGQLYDSKGITTRDKLVNMGFEELLYYSPPDGLIDLEWINDASNEDVKKHSSEYLVRQESLAEVKKANNYSPETEEIVRKDFVSTIEKFST